MKKLLIGYSWLLIVFPALIIFRNVIFGNLPTWGDAPFYYQELLWELFSEPKTWVDLGTSFGAVNSVLWIYPLMFLFGLLNKLFLLGNDSLIRLVFCYPSFIFAFIGPYLLTKYLKLSKITQFFSSLIYLINTYFILLVDGGQIGISLAYGLFPLTILTGKKMLEKRNLRPLIGFTLTSFLLCLVDPRISIISFITLFIWQMFENWKKVYLLIIAGLLVIPLNFYWVLPLLKIKGEALSLSVTNLQLSSLLNAVLLYAPHWPDNVFGKVVQPSFYFIFIPILIFAAASLIKKSKLITTLTFGFLIFAFMSKGASAPFGIWYDYLMKLPFGFAFRDSSKFFIPLILFGGILIGETTNYLGSKSKLFVIAIYFYLLFLVNPAFLDKQNFNLSNRNAGYDYALIYNNLVDKNGFFRTLWFPEIHPLSFDINGKEAVSAKNLVLSQPFSFMNLSQDPFNFLNNSKYVDWLRTLGIKYIFLSGDQRNIKPTEKDNKDWETINALVLETSGLKKLDWGTNIPAYQLEEDNLPKYYFIKKLVVVVGPMLKKPIASVYLEDGKTDAESLLDINPDSISLLFNSKEQTDLNMVFLKKYFKSIEESNVNDWAFYKSGDYLKAKYELLVRGFAYNDFDYGKGIAFSTNINESVNFIFNVSESGKYVIASRVANLNNQNLYWKIESRELISGPFEYKIVNNTGFEVVNTVALIPKKEFEQAVVKTEKVLKQFGIVTLPEILINDWKKAEVKNTEALKFEVPDIPEHYYWIIFSENYHPLWNLKKGIEYFESFPVYSMINGFYIEPDWEDVYIEFKGQKYFRWGLFVSLVSILSLTTVFLIFIKRENERKDKRNIKN